MDFHPNYAEGEKYTDKQRNALSYGVKLRDLKCMLSMVQRLRNTSVLTSDEKEMIDVIINDATERSKNLFEDQKAILDSRSETKSS